MGDISGFEELRDQIADYQEKVQEAHVNMQDAEEEAVRETANDFQEDVRWTIRKKGLSKDGDLIESIRVERVGDARYRVETDKDYAIYLEYGTTGPITADDGGYLRFEDENGEVIFRKSVEGIDKQSFWRPNEREYIARGVLGENLESHIEDALEEAFR